MKNHLFIIFAVCFSLVAFAQNTSNVDFVIKNLGISVDGHFDSFSITTVFNDDTKTLENLSGSIDVSSIETGIDSRDEHLLEDDYFNTNKYKRIELKSTSVTKISNGNYKVKANLTIKGVTKQINIKVNVTNTNGKHKITSKFEINRRDYNVGGSSFVMSNTVKISVVHFEDL